MKECTIESSALEECQEKQEVLGLKSTNFNGGVADEKNERLEDQNMSLSCCSIAQFGEEEKTFAA